MLLKNEETTLYVILHTIKITGITEAVFIKTLKTETFETSILVYY